jgi:hypothetical protein
MAKRYEHVRTYKESVEALRKRIKKMNNDLKKMGIQNKKIRQIDVTNFLFKNPIFISDRELKELAKAGRRFKGGRRC